MCETQTCKIKKVTRENATNYIKGWEKLSDIQPTIWLCRGYLKREKESQFRINESELNTARET